MQVYSLDSVGVCLTDRSSCHLLDLRETGCSSTVGCDVFATGTDFNLLIAGRFEVIAGRSVMQ